MKELTRSRYAAASNGSGWVDPIVSRYLPTLPSRADFMLQVYGLDRAKMELLPFGVDDTITEGLDRDAVRRTVRADLGIPDDALVLVTGGKLDLRKNIHVLIDRFSQAKRAGRLADARSWGVPLDFAQTRGLGDAPVTGRRRRAG